MKTLDFILLDEKGEGVFLLRLEPFGNLVRFRLDAFLECLAAGESDGDIIASLNNRTVVMKKEGCFSCRLKKRWELAAEGHTGQYVATLFTGERNGGNANIPVAKITNINLEKIRSARCSSAVNRRGESYFYGDFCAFEFEVEGDSDAGGNSSDGAPKRRGIIERLKSYLGKFHRANYLLRDSFKTHFARSYFTASKCLSPILRQRRTKSCFASSTLSEILARSESNSSDKRKLITTGNLFLSFIYGLYLKTLHFQQLKKSSVSHYNFS